MPDTSNCGKPSDFVCDLLKDVLSNKVPGMKGVGIADAMTEAATGGGLVDCQW